MRYAHIVGWGSILPDRVLTNHDIAEMVETSDDWIVTRTGIRERRIASEKETTATLAFEAAARALSVAHVPASQVDLIIVATSTPEYIFPSTACRVQDYLGARNAGAFDLSAACSGFVYGLSMASDAIRAGSADVAVVVGSETMSRVLDWEDRGTCILFGDGAGAVVLKASSVPGGVLASTLRSDGSGGNLLRLPAVYHNTVTPLSPEYRLNGHQRSTIKMHGRQVFRFATSVLAETIEEVLERAELEPEDVSLIVPHQANARIIAHAAKKLKIPEERFHMNLSETGNTSAASIPLALDDAIRQGRLRPNDNVVFVGFGGGLTWAASVIKWGVTPQPVSWEKRQWRQARYIWARLRSRARQVLRRWSAFLAGSPTPDARLKDAERWEGEEQDED